jgi:hypothetical protein
MAAHDPNRGQQGIIVNGQFTRNHRMSVKIFVVFHKSIDERLIFDSFSKAEIEGLFALYAVNEKNSSKSVTRITGQQSVLNRATSNVIFEYHLDWYNPDLQRRGFCETSCYVHILKNKLYEPYEYIGVTQYDMRWSPLAAAAVRRLEVGERNTAYGMIYEGPAIHGEWLYNERSPRFSKERFGKFIIMDEGGYFNFLAFPWLRNWDFLLASYNKFFSSSWDKRILINKPLTLLQTYILPRDEFVALASWLEVLCREVYPWANQPPYETHWGALSGYMESAESLFIAAGLQEGRFRLEPLSLMHDESIHRLLSVSKDHYR